MPLLVKICGLKTPEALDVALDAGADQVGFVFFAPSPRNLGYAAARALGERVKGRAGKVALTVDADDEMLGEIVEALRPDMLQLHGTETPERVVAVRRRFRPAGDEGSADRGPRFSVGHPTLCRRGGQDHFRRARHRARPRGPAGSAKPFDWRLLEGVDPGIPFMLSGGLDVGNVADALSITRAPGVDVSSGVERVPGEKDPDKIRAFVRAARQADAALNRVASRA